jgi:hypothetical protein
MTRIVLIAGLILLAAILPLAAVPPAVVVFFSIVLIGVVTLFANANEQTLTFAAIPFFRGPPSR